MARQGGSVESGLDRALQWALEHQLGEVLESGIMFPGDGRANIGGKMRPWQHLIGEMPDAPSSETPILGAKLPVKTTEGDPAEAGETQVATPASDPEPAAETPKYKTLKEYRAEKVAEAAALALSDKELDNWELRDNLTGVVMVHGIGPQLAGQTLLDWTQPIIAALRDAVVADTNGVGRDAPILAGSDRAFAGITDPVFRANIDFSGETFPVVQVRIPRLRTETEPKTLADERRWIFTETWWATEVRPPSLRTMVGWLGEQGGVGRIVQGVQRNTFGGRWQFVAGLSVQPFVSVIVSFALLVLVGLLAITRLIPIASVRSAVTLKLASTFLTDWFGGARTLLRDPAQSANVRHRLVTTIKALRAYGCRYVVIVAHSGGTIVSLTTLTDPAQPKLNINKLITIGEALNLGWRLEAEDPDAEHATPPKGHRLLGNLADKPRLLWRDFYGTHDPAPSGPPDPPDPMRKAIQTNAFRGEQRFTAERVYNRMSVGGDHGGYWDNDEHFVIPLIREIDVANGDRGSSRFYSDEAESEIRARRKERISLLRLWRRATSALPIVAILAAALVTSGGLLPVIGVGVINLLPNVPFSKELGQAGVFLAGLGGSQPADAIYWLGVILVLFVFLLMLLQALIPSRAYALWWKRPWSSLAIRVLDFGIGAVVFLAIVLLWLGDRQEVRGPLNVLVLVAIAGVLAGTGVLLAALAKLGRFLRGQLRKREGLPTRRQRFIRGGTIGLSAIFLTGLLVLLVAATAGVVLVVAGTDALPAESEATRNLVVGALVVLVVFSFIEKIGEWRWDSWDARERHELRRRPLQPPGRVWAYGISFMFSLIAIATAIFVATGTNDEMFVWTRDGWLKGIAIALGGLVLVTIAKDVVDNDIDTEGRMTGAGVSGTIQPPGADMPKAPGS